MIVQTVGDLKAALAEYPDAMPLARPGWHGGEWTVGHLQVGYLDLVNIGHRRNNRMTVRADCEFHKTFGGWRSKPYRVLAMGGA